MDEREHKWINMVQGEMDNFQRMGKHRGNDWNNDNG